MARALFRFYAELNHFLPEKKRKIEFDVLFQVNRPIKDMIEDLGVPSTEIDLILVNGRSVDFSYIPQDKDRISVYPVFENLNIRSVTLLRRIPLRKTRFIVDTHLGDIAKSMRLLGFDVYYDPSISHKEIIRISKDENRIILTNSKRILTFREVTHVVFLRPDSIEDQIRQIIDDLDIRDAIQPFTRCLRCNSRLESLSKEE
ncbi:MAG: Mut7-C RNAse domain-containing protein, partial [Pseudomonadota bacterium]